MKERCAGCGGPASFSVVQDGVQTWSCDRCVDLLVPGAGLVAIAEAMSRIKRNPGKCPNCGTTLELATQTGLVGCPICYEMLDSQALAHFGVVKGGWAPERAWKFELPK